MEAQIQTLHKARRLFVDKETDKISWVTIEPLKLSEPEIYTQLE